MRISDWSSDVCSSDLRALTVTADTLSRLYGDANPALTYRIGGLGLVNGDSLSGALATSATRSSIPGSYPIVQGTLAASANYAPRFVPGVLTNVPVEPKNGSAECRESVGQEGWI